MRSPAYWAKTAPKKVQNGSNRYIRPTTKNGPQKNGGRWLARINRPLYFEKNGRRSRAAIINRRAGSVFSWPNPKSLFYFFLVGGTDLLKSCYGGGGTGQARRGKGVAEKNGYRFKKTARAGGPQSSQGAERKTRKIKTQRPRELESSIRSFFIDQHVHVGLQ